MPRAYSGVDLLPIKDAALEQILRQIDAYLRDVSRQLSTSQAAPSSSSTPTAALSASNAVQGPSSAVDSNVATYDGTTGKLIKDSGITTTSVTNAVTASAVIADNAIVRGDGGSRGVQGSAWTIDDSGNAIPDNDASQDIGSSALNINDLYLGGQVLIADAQANIQSSVACAATPTDAITLDATDALANNEAQNIVLVTGSGDGTLGKDYFQFERSRAALTRTGRFIVGTGTANNTLTSTSWIRANQWTFNDNGTADGSDPQLKLTSGASNAKFQSASTLALDFVSGISGVSDVSAGPGIGFDIDGSDAGSPAANDASFGILKTNDDLTSVPLMNLAHSGAWGATSRAILVQDGGGNLCGITQVGRYFSNSANLALAKVNSRWLKVDITKGGRTQFTDAGTTEPVT